MNVNIALSLRHYLFFVFLASMLLTPLSSAEEKFDPNREVQVIADSVVAAFNERSPEDLCAILDLESLARRAAKQSLEAEWQQDQFVQGFLGASSQVCTGLIANVKMYDGRAKFLRITKPDSNYRILTRLDLGDGGFEYMEYLVDTAQKNNFRIVDWYQLTTGQLMSETIGSVSQLIKDPNPNILQRFLGMSQIDENLTKQIRQFIKAAQHSKAEIAYVAHAKLPPEIRYHRFMITLAIGVASRTGDDVKYQEFLGLLAKHHGDDPAAAFLLIDYYFTLEKWPQVLSAFDAIEARFGQDAMLEFLRANVHLQRNDLASLEQHAKNAIKLESDFDDAYFSLLTGYVMFKKYPEAIEVMDTLIAELGYSFSKADLEAEPFYADFLKSTAFKQWPYMNESHGSE